MNSKETRLQQSVTQLRTRLLVMGAAVGIALDEACAALETANIGRAVAVVDGDAAIDAMENGIDDLALSLLARHQPVAQDLRLVVAALRMVIDLERIGDEAAGIAERVVILQEKLPSPVMPALASLIAATRDSYRRALAAFRDADTAAALAIIRDDGECSQREVLALHQIMDYHDAPASASRTQTVMHGILISRSLNRICRRSANIAEHAYFLTQGVNLKHTPPPDREERDSYEEETGVD